MRIIFFLLVFSCFTIANQGFKSSSGSDTISININEIDTSLYNNMFSFWQRVEIYNGSSVPNFVGDLNGNGKPEIYGSYLDANRQYLGPVRIFEMDDDGKYKLQTLLSDSSSIIISGFGNIDGKGESDLYVHNLKSSRGMFFLSDSTNDLPTKYAGLLSYNTNGQINNMTFGDFDNNGIPDCIFSSHTIVIGEYRESIQNFSFLFYKGYYEGISKFAISDFDDDGRTEFIYSSVSGIVRGIENSGNNSYKNLLWEYDTGLLNAYGITVTNDIDGNGKKEFWISGLEGASYQTFIKCFEANGDDNYEEKAVIKFPESAMFLKLIGNDLDDDGIDELLIQFGTGIMALKFTGVANYHDYKILYVKFQPSTQPYKWGPVQIADLDLDGKKDLLIPLEDYHAIYPYFSHIYTQNSLSNIKVESTNLEKEFLLTQNYPNPFNPSTKINYSLAENAKVFIKVFDILGNEVATLVNEEKPAGNYEAAFDASGLSSGIYIYNISVLNKEKILFTQSNKMLLLK